MVLDFFPLGIKKIDNFFEEINYKNKDSQKELLINTMDDRFCTYVDKNNDSFYICGKRIRNMILKNCCREHLKFVDPILYEKHKYYKKKDKSNIYYCSSNSTRRKRCGNIVKNEGDICSRHLQMKEKNKKTCFFGSIKINYEHNNNIGNINTFINDNDDHKQKRLNKNKKGKKGKLLSSSFSFSKNINYNNIDYKYKFNIGEIEIKNKYEKNEEINYEKYNNGCKDDKTPEIVYYNFNKCKKCKKCNIKIDNHGKQLYCFSCFNYLNKNKYYMTYTDDINVDGTSDKKDKVLSKEKNELIKLNKELRILKNYIENNKKLLYLKKNNRYKKMYYSEVDIKNLLESFNLRYEILIEDLYLYGKINWMDLIKLYKEDIDNYIVEFYNIDNKYKLYI